MKLRKPEKLFEKYRHLLDITGKDVGFIVINVVTVMQCANMQFLGSSMRGLEKELGLSLKKLSLFVTAELVSNLVSIPVWGYMCDHLDLKYILLPSTFVSAGVLVFLSFIRDQFIIFVARVVNGAMMGVIIPVSQKFVSVAKMKNPGYAFGLLHIYSNLGRFICCLIVTSVASNVYSGVYGWRLCSIGLALTFLLTGFAVLASPMVKTDNSKPFFEVTSADGNKALAYAKVLWKKITQIYSIKTVILLTLSLFLGQGVYTAAYFVTIYFQYCRLSNLKAGVTTAAMIIFSAVGGAVGGALSDKIHHKYPKHGRLLMGVGLMGVRMLALIFGLFCLTFDNIPEFYGFFLILMILIGLTFSSISFIDRSVALDVIVPDDQSFGSSIILFLSGVASSMLFPHLLGVLITDVFGYRNSTLDLEDMPYPLMRNNAFALRNAIALFCMFSCACTLAFYGAMTLTYHKDAKLISEKGKLLKPRSSSISEVDEVADSVPVIELKA